MAGSSRGNQMHRQKKGNKTTKPTSHQNPAQIIWNLRMAFRVLVSFTVCKILGLELDFNWIILRKTICYALFFGLFEFFLSLVL